MSIYTKEQFEHYKGDKPYVLVSYEFKGDWQELTHTNYEDYINCYTLYSFILKILRDDK